MVGLVILLGFVSACGNKGKPLTGQTLIADRWQVVVASTGKVDLIRTLTLDDFLSPYLRGSTQLNGAPLLGELPSQTRNDCTLLQNAGQVQYSCRMTYAIAVIPTQLEATLVLPDDNLLRFLTDLLGYQPVPMTLNREISISVPGRVLPLAVREVDFFPVYSQQATMTKQGSESELLLTTEITLAPGDLPNPRLQHLPEIHFEPLLGFRQ